MMRWPYANNALVTTTHIVLAALTALLFVCGMVGYVSPFGTIAATTMLVLFQWALWLEHKNFVEEQENNGQCMGNHSKANF